MYLVLFGLGLLVTAAGLVTIGFGIPINAFSLGNTLIIAGTIAVVGGLILIGLATAVRRLNRISEALAKGLISRPVSAPAAAETADSLVPPTARIQPAAAARSPAPSPKSVEVPRQVEPRFPVATPAGGDQTAASLDWLRQKPKPVSEAPSIAPEPPAAEPADEIQRTPRRPAFPSAPLPREAKSEPAPGSEQIARATPPSPDRPPRDADAAKDQGLFDVVWPDARAKPGGAEPARREPKLEPAPLPRTRDERPAQPPLERPAAVLKSGVIDGMAYTLYVDGSIEAELPQGTVKFASVDALRAHLEKST